jgi:hypothetical protein
LKQSRFHAASSKAVTPTSAVKKVLSIGNACQRICSKTFYLFNPLSIPSLSLFI